MINTIVENIKLKNKLEKDIKEVGFEILEELKPYMDNERKANIERLGNEWRKNALDTCLATINMLVDRLYELEEDFTDEEIQELEAQLLSMSSEELEFAKDNICKNNELLCGDYDIDEQKEKAMLLKNKIEYPTRIMENTINNLIEKAETMVAEIETIKK